MTDPRVGLGFDAHPAGGAGPLMLAGVRFEDAPGLAGHSDGDVVCHALADAMLGAAGLGDLGTHFPESDPAIEGIPGLDLLSRTREIVEAAGWHVRSCDLTVIAERPSLAPWREEMRSTLAESIGAPVDGVSVKATRPEGLGLAGDGAGCIAIAVLGPPSG
jgi:2-C-methyl-D-erythritol 2,4-cyclodiphosphate synthase